MTLDRLYRDVENLKQQYRGLAGGPQLALSSIENGAIDSMDADGNLKMTIGQQDDGGNTINVVSGPTPPTPVGFTVDVDHGKFVVHWSGDFAGDKLAPSDWSRAEVHASQDPFFVPSRATARGSIVSAAGGEVTIGVLKGPWTIKMLAWSQAGKMSAPSAPVDVEVPGYGDIVLEEIDAATTLIKNAGEMLLEGQQTLADKLAGIADLDPEEISEEIAQARQEAIDAALAEIANVEGTLTSAIGAKSSTTWSTSNPPANYDGAVGDTWVKLTSLGSGGREIRRSRWQGDVWVDHPVDGAVLSNVDASTITTGFLDVVNRIRTGAILADKLLIGGGSNLLVNPTFANNAEGWGTSLTPGPGGKDGTTLVKTPASTATVGGYHGATSGGDKYHAQVNGATSFTASVWARSDVDIPAGKALIYMRAFTADNIANTTYTWASPSYAGNAEIIPANTWGLITRQFDPPPGTLEVAFGLYSQSGFSGAIEFCQPSFRPMVDGTLITPGGVQTPNLAADVLEVGNLKAGTAALAEAVIKKLFAEVVVARMAQAEEFIGENAILTGAVTAPKITASEELWAKIAQFVRIYAEQLDADAINGMVITAPTIQSARSGRRWVAGVDSIRVIDENEDVRTELSPDGSTFKGEVEAETLVVNEGAEFKANNTLAQGAKLTLAAGVTDPTAPPTVQPFWDGLEFENPADVPLLGLAWDGTNYWTVGRSGWWEGSNLKTVLKINATTGATESFYLYPTGGSYTEFFGVTCIGSELFFLYRTQYTGRVVVTDLNCVEKRKFDFEDMGYSPTNPLTYKPGIGNDGTNVVIAHAQDNGTLRVRTFNKTTGVITKNVAENNTNFKGSITGVYIGSADDGTARIYVNKVGPGRVYAYNTNAVSDGTGSFDTATASAVGVAWADGKFRTLDPSGIIHEYADINMGDETGDWWATYRWSIDENDDGYNDYTSRIGPSVRFTWPRRSKLKFIGAPLPLGVGYISPSIAKKTTKPTRADFRTPNWSVREGTSVAWYNTLPTDWQSGSAPSDTNDFPSAEPSVLESASATFQVKGDGSGRWGPLTISTAGKITSGLLTHASGEVSITPTGSSGTRTGNVYVTFPAGRFSVAPKVVVSALTSVPGTTVVGVGASGVTTSGFTAYLARVNNTTTPLAWIAMEEG
ncbi:hypothetical protein KTJ89_11235 [Brevibacterium sediminis]|uniref:hypothetical protein n=1 Tax=Brevibacterium sediminis TaxID=1857024 RepID=UPI002174D6E5|nr:hypothetical protein [Brevibacterium sediminis]MCS4593554.1 hypothetical protein [Brevibacterium sediminis]